MQACRLLRLPAPLLRRSTGISCSPTTRVLRRCNATSAKPAPTRSDYLGILGLSEGATPADIKQAYYTLSLELHPDRNPGDEEAQVRFMAVLEAYERLTDVARNPADVISRMEKEREVTWKPDTANMDEIMEKARHHLDEHYRRLGDDPATQPPLPETAAHYRELTTQCRNIGVLAVLMLVVIGIIHVTETGTVPRRRAAPE